MPPSYPLFFAGVSNICQITDNLVWDWHKVEHIAVAFLLLSPFFIL